MFDQTVLMMMQQPESLGAKIMEQVSSINFEKSGFLNFLFKYLLSIRGAMFNKNEVQS